MLWSNGLESTRGAGTGLFESERSREPVAAIPIAERIAILERNEGWFGRAPGEFRAAVLARCEWRECHAGQTVYHATDPSVDLFGIVDGTVEVYSRFASGDNPLLHLAHEGCWFSYGPMLSAEEPRVTVVARVDTLLARMPRRSLQQLLDARPEWWRVLGTAALDYGDIAVRIADDLLIRDNERRCAATLLRIGGQRYPRRTRTDRADVPVTQDELAALVNVSRTTLVQVLQRLERRGLIAQHDRTVRIANPSRLVAFVDGR